MFYVYSCYAGLAQLVEQRIRNAWVGRSNLLTGTNKETPPCEEFFYWYREGEKNARITFILFKHHPHFFTVKFG